MALTDQQIELLLTELETGTPLSEIQSRFPEEAEEIALIAEVKCFMEAQALEVSPDKAGLKSALNQAIIWDDEEVSHGWGTWMRQWRWIAPLSLSFALLLFVFDPWAISPPKVVLTTQESVAEPSARMMRGAHVEMEFVEDDMAEGMVLQAMDTPMATMASDEVSSEITVTDPMDVLVKELSQEFDSELVEYQNLKEDLKTYYNEEIFSLYPQYQLVF